MNLAKTLKRFFIPSLVVTAVYLFKYKCKVSPKSEVDLSDFLVIGKGTQISSFCKIKATDGSMIIGENVSVATGCFISSDTGGVEIGDRLVEPRVQRHRRLPSQLGLRQRDFGLAPLRVVGGQRLECDFGA